MARAFLCILFVLACGSAALASTLGFMSEGTIGWGVPLVSLELDASLAVTYAADDLSGSLSLDVGETGLRELAFDAALSGAEWDFAATMTFDVPGASVAEGELTVSLKFDAAELAICLVRQGDGAAVELAATDDGPFRSFALGLNVDAYGQVQTQSCVLDFTYAEVETGFSCECADVGVTAMFTSDGFSELVLSAADVGGLALGIEFGAQVRYTTNEKTAEVVPSFTLGNPECFDLYLGLVWDEATQTLEGISLYGIGLACEVGGVRVRGLWELDSDMIALVEAPYWALVGLVWDTEGCCGAGEASVAFFFGDDGLFDLGEIQFGLEWPVKAGWTASLVVAIETSAGASVTLGWSADL